MFQILFLIIGLFVNQQLAQSQDPIFAENGMVVSTSKQASEIGIRILKQGGNAIDAACAVGFALAVTSSSNGNIGGGGFMVAYLADGTVFTLDYREKAPAAAYRDMFLDDNGNVIKDMSLKTRASSGVPGSVDGLLKAWSKYGSGNISLRELLYPSISLAERGFKLSVYEAQTLNTFKELFSNNEAAAKIFIRSDNRDWKSGDRLVQKDLGKTLKRIARYGRNGFYSGITADLIISEMDKGAGYITYEDLRQYESKFREPVAGTFNQYEIISMGPPSSGGTILIEMLNMLELFPLNDFIWNSSNYIHLLTEVQRRAYADRAEHLGDADFWNSPTNMLLKKSYAKNRIKDFSPKKASPSKQILPGDPYAFESSETTHYSIIDKYGNAVSVTTTINLAYGSGIVVDGAGFFLNNEMDDFSSKPGVPNSFGLVGNEANSIEPGKRPLSSMTPTIVLKNKKPFLILGSPGGSRIITSVLQALLNITIHNMSLKEAVSLPRVHSQWLPDAVYFEENSLNDDVKELLIDNGHTILPFSYIGNVNAILINENGYTGYGDPRGENTAKGY
jgi:gamma-glutamyltranspeptidase/glutathione hydrolase|tara:strand:+ start:238 stop:1923 length:1686 start_codon:yes stop_codon:yes gene_type:complete